MIHRFSSRLQRLDHAFLRERLRDAKRYKRIAGYFRSFELDGPNGERRGYHKPIMIAGGYGSIREALIDKAGVPAGAAIVVLGGPAMLIGLGGGAASSMATGASSEDLDFASVQRGNPEIQRRAQEVIDRCAALGDANPILSIHDVGAGGLPLARDRERALKPGVLVGGCAKPLLEICDPALKIGCRVLTLRRHSINPLVPRVARRV